MTEIYEGMPTGKPLTQSAEDWGIESDEDLIPQESSEDEYLPKPVQRDPLVGRSEARRPLKLGSNGRFYTREVRFRILIRSLFTARVSEEETERFTEQFRFNIISSSLLEAQPLFTCWSQPTHLRRKKLMFDKSRPWIHLYVHKLSSFGGPMSISAIAYYLHLRFRMSATRAERVAVAVVIFFVVVIYWFATSRRRHIRSLREKVLVYMDQMLQSAKYLDGDIVRVIKELQDLDLCTAGFAPNARAKFVARDNNNLVYGRKIRSVLASTLHLMLESYLNGLSECIKMVSMENFRKYLAIYGVYEIMPDFGFELDPDSSTFTYNDTDDFHHSGLESCYVSVVELKRELRKVHFVRRVVLCALLAMEPNPGSAVEDLNKWTTVADNINHIGALSQQMSQLICSERFVEKAEPLSLHRNSNPLSDVMVRIRHLNARIDIINEAQDSSPQYNLNVDAVKDEISDLMIQWEQFLHNSRQPHQSELANSTQILLENPSSVAPSPTLISTPELGDSSAISSITATELGSYDSSYHNINSLSIFEGEAPFSMIPAGSKLSRDERIRIAREAREKPKVPEPNLQSSLAHELTNVMLMRSSGGNGPQ